MLSFQQCSCPSVAHGISIRAGLSCAEASTSAESLFEGESGLYAVASVFKTAVLQGHFVLGRDRPKVELTSQQGTFGGLLVVSITCVKFFGPESGRGNAFGNSTTILFRKGKVCRYQNSAMNRPLILVVDDQRSVAQAAQLVLEYAGMDVLVATSPAEATAIWKSRKADIHLLMTDFDLEDPVHGEQLARNFEADKPSLRSLIVTAHALDDHHFPGRTEGVDFLRKPWNASSVISAVKWLLKNQGQISIPSEALAC